MCAAGRVDGKHMSKNCGAESNVGDGRSVLHEVADVGFFFFWAGVRITELQKRVFDEAFDSIAKIISGMSRSSSQFTQ